MQINRNELLALRHRYRSAYTSYLSCVQALSDVALHASRPSRELIANEASSLKEVTEARKALLRAILTEIETGAL